MLQIDEQFIKDLGLDTLPKESQARIVRELSATLETRISMALASKLSDEQLDALPEEVDADWLKENIPEYEQVAQAEFDTLKSEMIEDTKKLLDN